MAYNTKAIKKDVDGKPIPQIFDAVKDEYEVIQGRNGAQRIEIYGPDGNPLSTTSNKLDVRASELETLLSALGAKDFATQTTLAAILAKIIAAPATEAKQDEIKALLTAIRDTSGIKKITDAVDIGDRAARVLGKITADDGAIAALGALAAAAVTDPTASASVIALLKGLIKQLQGTGTGAAPVTLTGSNLPLVAGTAEIGKVQISGNVLAEQKTQADAVAGVLTFATNISTVEIYNTDATNDGVFSVNGIVISVPAGKVYKSAIGGTPSPQITITGSTTYIVSRYV